MNEERIISAEEQLEDSHEELAAEVSLRPQSLDEYIGQPALREKLEIYLKAAKMLLDEGHIAEADVPWDTDGYKPATTDFIDGIKYDPKKPVAYLNSHSIGNKDPE